VHCDIIFTKLQAQPNSLSQVALLEILKPGFRISLWSTLMTYSFSFIYIFSKFSYKKNVHLQMSIRIGMELLFWCSLKSLQLTELSFLHLNTPLEKKLRSESLLAFLKANLVHITLIYCTEWLFLQSVPVSGFESYSIFCNYCCHMTI
jgi:hypothetical protein